MMDIKEIIKWFIPCFHILLRFILNKKIVLVCFCLFFNLVASSRISSDVSSDSLVKQLSHTKKLDVSSVKYEDKVFNQSEAEDVSRVIQDDKSATSGNNLISVSSTGRTFGRPFKKMMAGLLPVIFQVGAASTWAVVAALVGVKTLMVTLVILKLLLLAGAAKFGALFASKSPHHDTPHHPQKEIHLHIHNNGHEHHEEHIPTWSREGYPDKSNYVYEPYKAGPQTISTPFGNYMKIDSSISSPSSTAA